MPRTSLKLVPKNVAQILVQRQDSARRFFLTGGNSTTRDRETRRLLLRNGCPETVPGAGGGVHRFGKECAGASRLDSIV